MSEDKLVSHAKVGIIGGGIMGVSLLYHLAKEGWKVAVSARRVELLNKLAENENIYSYPLDITDTIKIKEVF